MDDLVGLGILILMLLGGDKKKGPPDRDPFCPVKDGKIYVWDPNAKTCVEWVPGKGEPPKPQGPDKPPPPDPKVPGEWIRDDWPKDGRVFQVSPGWILLGTGKKSVAFNAITDKAYRTALEKGLTHTDALAYASDRGHVGSNRVAYLQAIQCEPFNDKLYMTYGYGEGAMPAPNGRAVRMLPQHADNRARMLQGLPLIRSIRLRTPNDVNKGNGTAAPGAPSGHFEALYLPEIDGEHLWLTGQIRTMQGGPPKVIADLGWENKSGVIPASLDWGC